MSDRCTGGTERTKSTLIRLDLSKIIRERAKEKGVGEPITINIGSFSDKSEQLRVRVTGVDLSTTDTDRS